MRRGMGVFGGSFDPIHYGHLAVAEAARAELGLEQVLFVPAAAQPHKLHRHPAPAEHRWQMVCIAIAGNPGFAASRLELDRPGPSYTSDTLAQLRALVPADQEIVFICGADALLEVQTWHRPEAIFQAASVAAALRPGCGDELQLRQACAQIAARFGGRARLFDAPLLDISSRLIRSRYRRGQPVRYLLPDMVLDYLCHNGLYREEMCQDC